MLSKIPTKYWHCEVCPVPCGLSFIPWIYWVWFLTELEDAAIHCPVFKHQHIPPPFILPILLAEGLYFMIYIPLFASHTPEMSTSRLPGCAFGQDHTVLSRTWSGFSLSSHLCSHSPPFPSTEGLRYPSSPSSCVSSSNQSSWVLWIQEARWQASDVWPTARSVWGLEDATVT